MTRSTSDTNRKSPVRMNSSIEASKIGSTTATTYHSTGVISRKSQITHERLFLLKALGWILLIASQDAAAVIEPTGSSFLRTNQSDTNATVISNHTQTIILDKGGINSTQIVRISLPEYRLLTTPEATPKVIAGGHANGTEYAFSNGALPNKLSEQSINSNRIVSVKQNRDHDTSSSLLRPSFLRHLFGRGRVKEEDEEEVTQTIVVPLNADDSKVMQKLNGPTSASSNYMISRNESKLGSPMSSAAARLQKMSEQVIQPKAEASLQLTSTQMNRLLSDREGPEFYREREITGDGITLSEEHPKLVRQTMEASGSEHNGADHLSGGLSSPVDGPYPALDTDEAELREALQNQQRHGSHMMKLASDERLGSNSGFNQRFGETFDEVDAGSGTAPFGNSNNMRQIMQSQGTEHGPMPLSNEFDGQSIPFHHYNSFGRSADESINPSLMPSGSRQGAFGGTVSSSASNFYGPGFSASSEPGEQHHFESHSPHNRLGESTSADELHNMSPHLRGAGEDVADGSSFTSRLGMHANGFADRIGPSEMSGSHFNERPERSSAGHLQHYGGSSGLMPLSPVVPTSGDELGAATSGRQFYSPASSSMSHQRGHMHRSELIRSHDAGDIGNSDGDNINDNDSESDGPRDSFKPDSSLDWNTSAAASVENLNQLQRDHWNNGDIAPSFVLNVPPPRSDSIKPPNLDSLESNERHRSHNDDDMDTYSGQLQAKSSSLQHPTAASGQPVRSSYIEFKKVGSAGYLAPRRIMIDNQSQLIRKSNSNGPPDGVEEAATGDRLRPFNDQASVEPSGEENPAHVGKYIVE